MKASGNLQDVRSVVSAIARKEIRPIYVITGSEDFLVFQARQRIAEGLGGVLSGAGMEVLDGSEVDMATLLHRLHSPSLFEPTQIIVLREARIFEPGRAEEARALQDWVVRFSEPGLMLPAVLICTAEKIDKRTNLAKLISKTGVLLDFPTPAGYDRGDIQKDPYYPVVREILDGCGKQIRAEAWMRFRQKTANNLWAVMNSINMLISSIDSRPEIQVSDVDALLGFSDDIPVFSITDALGKRDASALSLSLDALLSTGTPALVILKLLINRINVLLASKAFLAKHRTIAWNPKLEYWRFKNDLFPSIQEFARNDPAFVQIISGQHPYALYMTLQQASIFDENRLKHAIYELADIDSAVKSTNKSPLVLFEMALLPLCR